MIYDRFSSNGFEEKQAVVNEGVDEWSMSASRNNEAEIDLQGQAEFQHQGRRAKHEHQNQKKETLYKKYGTPDRPAPPAAMLYKQFPGCL